MPRYSTGSLHRNDTSCPTCGARAEEGQLVCLECGSRVALDYRRPPSWRVPAAILVAVVVLALGGTVFAIKRIGDDAEREVRRTPVKVGRPSGAQEGKGKGDRPPAEAEKKQSTGTDRSAGEADEKPVSP